MQRLITLWCGVAVLTAVFVGATRNAFWSDAETLTRRWITLDDEVRVNAAVAAIASKTG